MVYPEVEEVMDTATSPRSVRDVFMVVMFVNLRVCWIEKRDLYCRVSTKMLMKLHLVLDDDLGDVRKAKKQGLVDLFGAILSVFIIVSFLSFQQKFQHVTTFLSWYVSKDRRLAMRLHWLALPRGIKIAFSSVVERFHHLSLAKNRNFMLFASVTAIDNGPAWQIFRSGKLHAVHELLKLLYGTESPRQEESASERKPCLPAVQNHTSFSVYRSQNWKTKNLNFLHLSCLIHNPSPHKHKILSHYKQWLKYNTRTPLETFCNCETCNLPMIFRWWTATKCHLHQSLAVTLPCLFPGIPFAWFLPSLIKFKDYDGINKVAFTTLTLKLTCLR